MLPRRTNKVMANRRTPKTQPAPVKVAAKSRVDWSRARLWVVGVFFCVLWAGLWARAFQLQVIQGPELAEKARRQHMTSIEVAGVRGNILDRNGNILARSVDCKTIWVNPTQIADPEKTAVSLSKITGIPVAKLSAKFKSKKKFAYIARKVSFSTAEAVKEAHLPGIYLMTEYERIYPNKYRAGQLLGFVNIDGQGIEGLELAFEDQLRGRKTRQYFERDAVGNRMLMDSQDDLENLRGQDLSLTIDAQVQFFAEEALAENVKKFEAKWGGCMVVDVPTGEILAWAQYPFFNPNAPAQSSQLVRRNRLAMDALEQGSTIKSFLIAAALQEKAVTPDTEINCEKGRWKLRSATIHDTHSWGILPVRKILHVSSNIGAAKIGAAIGAQKLHAYLSMLGFGEKTDLPLAGEAKGILRPYTRWQEIDLAATSFGQSFSANLAQMAQAYLCLAGDGTKRPLKLLMADPDDQDLNDAPKERIFSEETVKIVRDMLREVVEEDGGTGRQARISGLVAGGKTGTAQKADRTGKYGKGRVGSFVGMIPADKPRYLVLVLLDEPVKNQYGGIIAAPVFKDVALRTMAYHGHLPDAEEILARSKEKENGAAQALENIMAKQSPMTSIVSDALQELQKSSTRKGGAPAQGKPNAKNSGNQRAQAQAPEKPAGQAAKVDEANRVGAPIVKSDKVPSVVGLNMQRAIEVFAAQGIVPTLKGSSGTVIRQSPEPGSAWPQGNAQGVFVLWLEEKNT